MTSVPWYRDPVDVGSFFVPAIWIVITLIVRRAMKAKQTSGADLIGVLIAFNVALILDPNVFIHLAAPDRVMGATNESIIATSVAFLFGCLLCWIVAMMFVEPHLAGSPNLKAGYFARRGPFLWGAVSWGVCWLLTLGHIWNFRGKIL